MAPDEGQWSRRGKDASSGRVERYGQDIQNRDCKDASPQCHRGPSHLWMRKFIHCDELQQRNTP